MRTLTSPVMESGEGSFVTTTVNDAVTKTKITIREVI